MYRNLSLALVIPCLNEERGIRAVLENVPAEVDEIIIVDGGSKDQTREIASTFLRTKVILEPKRGYGLAYKRGFEAVKSDLIVTADGDGTYPCSMIPSLVDTLVDQSLDFLSGSRFPLKEAQAMKKLNFIGNTVITFFLNILYQTKLSDGLSGMWVFRKPILDQIQVETNDWNFSPEIKLAVLSNPRLKFAEKNIPYAERIGESKLIPWSVGLSNVLFLIRRRISPPS